MTKTTIVCLAVWLILFALSAFHLLPVFIVGIAAIVEAILILLGSRLTS